MLRSRWRSSLQLTLSASNQKARRYAEKWIKACPVSYRLLQRLQRERETRHHACDMRAPCARADTLPSPSPIPLRFIFLFSFPSARSSVNREKKKTSSTLWIPFGEESMDFPRFFVRFFFYFFLINETKNCLSPRF